MTRLPDMSGLQKSNPESYPFFEQRKQGWQKEPVLSPSLGFVGQGIHTERGDRSQLRRSHWQQFPFKHLESWR
jgi:hypothetical protein